MPVRLMAVGPLPPPADGTSISFYQFRKEVSRHAAQVTTLVVDSSPRRLKEEGHRLGFSDFGQAIRIIVPYLRRLREVDRVLVFGSNGFQLRMAPWLLLLAKIVGKPCYLRVFGGSLDHYLTALSPLLQRFLLSSLRTADGVLVQTELLRRYLEEQHRVQCSLIPGYRSIPPEASIPGSERVASEKESKEIKLVFLGHVRAEKGILVLLESLRRIVETGHKGISCDIYGPIYPSVDTDFRENLDRAEGVTYRGVLEMDAVLNTLTRYDALVFPTYYQGEGHPGVILEAMIAGLPVLTTRFRSIPEVVEHGVNGLLVPPRDPEALARAILTLVQDRTLRDKMARASRARGRSLDLRHVMPRILDAVGIQWTPDADESVESREP